MIKSNFQENVIAVKKYNFLFMPYRIFILILITSSLNHLNAQIFTKVISEPINSSTGQCFSGGFLDYNGDGLLDILGLNVSKGHKLYINNQDGTFSLSDDATIQTLSSLVNSGIALGDYDNDGLDDLLLTSNNNSVRLVHRNDLDSWEIVSDGPIIKIQNIALDCLWEDINNDGLLDIFMPTVANLNFAASPGANNLLYMNMGDGVFESETNSVLTTSLANNQTGSFGDYDNDGDRDLFLTEWGNDNYFFENNGDGTFTKIDYDLLLDNTNVTMSCVWGDFNNDGFLDLYVGNGALQTIEPVHKNYLFMNNGDKTFDKITEGDAVNFEGNTLTTITGDFDNDGDLDIFAGQFAGPNTIFLNDGNAVFTRIDAFDVNSSGASGCAVADYDDDGFLDIYTGNGTSENPGNALYHNNTNENNWFFVKCIGKISNRNAVGARAKIKATISGKSVWQIREISYNQGFRSGCDLKAHFGLGDAEIIDSVVIYWPSKQVDILTNVSVNQILEVEETVSEDFMKCIFSANKTSGYSPLTVQFSDRSMYNNNHLITSWSWDFNGDGIEDSDEQNPQYTFEIQDEDVDFTVSLTVSSDNVTRTYTRSNYIKVTPASKENLGRGIKPVTSSSLNPIAVYGPHFATDGIASTRWTSAASDTQWIQLELDEAVDIGRIVLAWGVKYPLIYNVLCSLDGISWNTITSIETGDGENDELVFAVAKAKYVRVDLYLSNNNQGYELRELEIYRPYVTGLEPDNNLPNGYMLMQNYPNPFNPSTRIKFRLPESSDVRINVYNALGQQIEIITDEHYSAGIHEAIFNADNLPSGVYFYQIVTKQYVNSKKMLLIK